MKRMKKLFTTKPFFRISSSLILLIVTLLVSILFLLLHDKFMTGPSVYYDFITSQTAADGSNKTGEWHLFWMLLWIGCFTILFLFLLRKKLYRFNQTMPAVNFPSSLWFFACLPFTPFLLQIIFYGESTKNLFAFSFIVSIMIVLRRQNALHDFLCFLILYFDIQVLWVIFSLNTHYREISDFIFISAALLLFIVFDKTSQNLYLYAQLPLPFLLLLYLKNSYSMEGVIQKLSFPLFYQAVIFTLIFILLILCIRHISYKIKNKTNSFFTLSSVISIFVYTSYLSPALIVPTDLHHHGEQILAWQQIVTLGREAFVEYSPVSGLFPLILGAIHKLVGGTATTYAASYVLFYILFAILIISLVYRCAGCSFAFLLAFLFHMPNYCRTWLLIPSLLILFLPCMQRNRLRFLYTYVFLGFIGGLYYPLFGFAFITALLPFALIKFYYFIKQKDYQKEWKNPRFYIATLLLFAPIFACIPLLKNMAKHILSYSHQTVLADGLSLSSVDTPSWFLPYLTLDLSTIIYQLVRFIGPMIAVFVCLLLLLNHLEKQPLSDKLENPLSMCFSVAFLILPLCYTYTLVIMDEDWVSRLFSRSSHVYLWIFGFYLPIFLHKYYNRLKSKKFSVFVTLCLSVPFVFFYQMKDYQFPALDGITNAKCATVFAYQANLAPFQMPEDIIPIRADVIKDFPQIGSGFIQKATLDQTYAYHSSIDSLRSIDPDCQILGLDTKQFYYFLLNEPAPYSGKPSLAKSQEANAALLSSITEHTVIGTDLKSFHNYEVFRLLEKNGYKFDPTSNFYLPKKLFIAKYGEATYNAMDNSNSPFGGIQYIGCMAYSFGNSIDSLSSVLKPSTDKKEFLYIELKPHLFENATADTILQFSWGNACSILCDYGNGKLLIPLDYNCNFTDSYANNLAISFYNSTDVTQYSLEKVTTTQQFYSYIDPK